MKSVMHGLGIVLCTLLTPALLAAQTGTITGVVRDAQTSQPLAAAHVQIPGLDLSTLTQEDGRFRLDNVPVGTHTVTVQRLGYRSMSAEVTVGEAATVMQNFNMTQDALRLDALVVTGVAGGTQRKAVGNVVTSMDVSSLKQTAPVVTAEQVLGQRAPGVIVMPSSGAVGHDAGSIRIRGSSSPGLKNDPLIYVDGVRINSDIRYADRQGGISRLNDINPADIESIEIIKGPAAATLYGTEASNGVIQIITKRGSTGAPTFDAFIDLGTHWLPDPAGKVGTMWGFGTDGQIISGNPYEWYKAMTGKDPLGYGSIRNYGVSVRGGTSTARYYGSINYSDRVGIVDWNWDRKTNARLNLGLTPIPILSVETGLAIIRGKMREDGSSSNEHLWGELLWANPAWCEICGGRADRRLGLGRYTPEALRDYRERYNGVSRYMLNLQANFTPFDWFRHRLIVGTDVTHDTRTQYTPKDEVNAWFGTASRLGQKSHNRTETVLTTVDYSGTLVWPRLFGSKLGGATSAGLQYSSRTMINVSASGTNFATPALSTIEAASEVTGSESELRNITVGTYLQHQLDWQERLFLTGAIRFDDNSAFGDEFDAAIYPKFSATWTLHEEPFWNIDFFDQFRFRAAWGQAGQQPDVFAATRLYQVQTGPGGQPIVTPQTFGNPNLAPEKSQELEVGFDASFLNERVSVEFTRYWRTTKDVIVERLVAPSLGIPSRQLVNIGGTKNWGTETQVDVALITSGPIRWNLSGSFATMGNVITDLGDEEFLPVGRSRQHREGFPLAGMFSKKVLSAEFVSGNSGPTTNEMCDGGRGKGGVEMGGPPVPCEEAPPVFWGKSEPTWMTTISSTVSFLDNWTFRAQVDARGGNIANYDNVPAKHTTFASSECHVKNDDLMCNAMLKVDRSPLGHFDASFAKLRELALTYNVPTQYAQRFAANRASVTVAWRNVATLWFPGRNQPGVRVGSKYAELVPDPELTQVENFSGDISRMQPPTSMLMATIRVSF